MYNLGISLLKSRPIFKFLNQKQFLGVLSNLKASSTKSKPKVLITRADLPREAIDTLKAECDVEIYGKPGPMPREELLEKISGKNGLFATLIDSVDKEVITAAGDDLRVISTMSVGYDHIDLKACKERNIRVSHTPAVSAGSVAEWTVLLMLCAGRRLVEAVAAVKNNEWKYQWDPSWLTGAGLTDAVVGIVGMGRIGQCVLARVLPFGVKEVLYFDAVNPIAPAEILGAKYTELDELAKNSDFIACTCDLNETTRNLFNRKVFDLMKSSAIFVNASRGDVVDQKDLYETLKEKKIRAAAIDVMTPEPLPQDHILTTLPNLIITPHLASSETTVLARMSKLVAENIILGVNDLPLTAPVPMPD